ncbi:uroporphyrinogen-III synthase [Tepidimonas charontis]|uniref:Uroporphyrinogen-III synthase n=1 Tax=Tepidimonas charontis TaxID=2267262 RepID=A0A554XFT5_9BURK|nr:uroporphyrinogen-III synthase [Tepidimonas charontis]TSE34701.1 Uroporphyrinogen-III synthase [Tepidimonas charontis]
MKAAAAASPARPTVVVTRPAEQAQNWITELQAAGWPVLALPLIAIESIADGARWRAVIGDGTGWDALWFASPAAVQVVRAAGVPAPSGCRCWAPGAGTADALRDWGVAAPYIDAPPPQAPQMDSEALWEVVAPRLRSGMRVLAVRGQSADGRTGRDWLARRCQEAGVHVHTLVVYRRVAPPWQAAQRTRAQQAARDGSIWLFSSSEALAHLRALLPAECWQGARALATHARIAQAARAAGFGTVVETRPTLADVQQALESLL